MIATPEELEKFRKAGKITARAREFAKSIVKSGVSYLEVSKEIEKKILELGGGFSFPPTLSVGKIAAHYCSPHDDTNVFKEGDLVKIDLGATYDGYVGDTAISVDLSDDNRYSDLISASKKALDAAIKIATPGTKLSEVGAVIESTITDEGFVPIRNLSGHGVGRYSAHEAPSVPNYDTKGTSVLMRGEVIAIEPFATDGSGFVVETEHSEIFNLIQKKPVRNPFVRTILKDIDRYKGLPFAARWLFDKHPAFKVNFALKELLNINSLQAHPPLIEKRNGIISQTEHTIYVDDKPEILTR